jgi:hypothetical protein
LTYKQEKKCEGKEKRIKDKKGRQKKCYVSLLVRSGENRVTKPTRTGGRQEGSVSFGVSTKKMYALPKEAQSTWNQERREEGEGYLLASQLQG